MLALLALPMAGCNSLLTSGTAVGAGAAGAAIAQRVTRNPTVATGIGLGVGAAAQAGLQYWERKVHQKEQDAIAALAGQLRPGQVGNWSVAHDVPIEDDEHGQLTVIRDVGTSQFACKEIVFSVETVEDKVPTRAFYTAAACRDGTTWKWASAEPATERWGALQ
jgi:hypothetical protein